MWPTVESRASLSGVGKSNRPDHRDAETRDRLRRKNQLCERISTFNRSITSWTEGPEIGGGTGLSQNSRQT
jgi:hypothetical protein